MMMCIGSVTDVSYQLTPPHPRDVLCGHLDAHGVRILCAESCDGCGAVMHHSRDGRGVISGSASQAASMRRSERAYRAAIKRSLSFQVADLLARRLSFVDDMIRRGMSGRAGRMDTDERARRCVVAQRYVTLINDVSVWHMPITGVP